MQAAHRIGRGDLVADLLFAGARAKDLFPGGRATALTICISYGEAGALLRPGHSADAPVAYEMDGMIEGSDDYNAVCLPVHLAVLPPRRPGPVLSPPQLECLRALVDDGGADVSGRDKLGFTPLHWLVCSPTRFDRAQALSTLLSLSADLEAQNVFGHTPFFLAAGRHDLEMAQLLLARGASANVRDASGHTPLMYA